MGIRWRSSRNDEIVSHFKTTVVNGVEVPRCQEFVYRPDGYRYTGRQKFGTHYTRGQCVRRATRGDYCYQHRKDGTR